MTTAYLSADNLSLRTRIAIISGIILFIVGGPYVPISKADDNSMFLTRPENVKSSASDSVSSEDMEMISSNQIASSGGAAIAWALAALSNRDVEPDPRINREAQSVIERCRRGVVLLIPEDSTSMGAGCVLDSNGYILTNWHVVMGHGRMMAICFDPAYKTPKNVKLDSCLIAKVIAVDSTRDLALLKVPAESLMEPLPLATGLQIRESQNVFAIGHPGSFFWTYTSGKISNLIDDYEWSYAMDFNCQADVIMTETPINPGNSGGPLFSLDGRLVGINTFVVPDAENLNFAVRLDEVMEFYEDALAGKYSYDHQEIEIPRPKQGVWDAVDANENGIIDTWLLDSNGDGYYDIAKQDTDEDSVIDLRLVDTNADHKIDVYQYDKDHDGYFEYWEMDTNFDGTLDTGGIDETGDGKPDRYFEL